MSNFKDKKILVFGLGLNQGGVGSAKFFASQGAKVRVTDLKNEDTLKTSLEQLKQFSNIEYTLGVHKNEDIDWADLIIKNPAIKPGNPYIEYAMQKGKEVKMDMDIFLQSVSHQQIIGVTGTKGKSTTSSLIYELLKNIGKDVVFAGNIGTSVLEIIPYIKDDTLVVLEISSFQLESFDRKKVSPKWAVITNITPDHLNYYSSMEEYIAAKRVIAEYQKTDDFLFIRKNDPITTKPEFLKGLKGQIVYFSRDDMTKGFKPTLLGEHNLENIAASYQVGNIFGINSERLLRTLTTFKGIPFRMEQTKIWNGVRIINDTAATSPESGIKSIQTFPNCILICGGMNKKMDYTKYAEVIDRSVRSVYFLEGDSTEEIKKLMKNKDLIKGTYNNLEKLLRDVKTQVKPGDVILFAPSATSFNLFQNEFDRGREFNKAVEKVFVR